MAEQALTYALTTKGRVKAQLAISVSSFDTILDEMINECTDFIESLCSRRFLSTTYTQEVYSHVGGPYLILKQAPVTALSALQYAAGYPSAKVWTDFAATDYELQEDGKSGIVAATGAFPKGSNVIRATYTAGYVVNWANAGDNSTHKLPADLTGLCERLVIRRFKKRDAEGKSQETFNGGSASWDTSLTAEDKAVINKYTRVAFNF